VTKPDIAIFDKLVERFTPLLADRFTLHPIGRDQTAPAGTRALVTSGGTGASASLIAAMPRLEIIAVDGVGCDAIDLEAARKRGVRVTNTPDVLTDDVADLAIGLIIAVYRQLCAGDRFVREGEWANGAMPLARRASGRRLGLVGLGSIGLAIARRAEPMMASIAYTTRRPRLDVPYRHVADIEMLAAESDILVLAVPGGAGTAGLVNRRVIDALGPEGVLINVARGTVVDEGALVEALGEGRLGGAGLDVFADEPKVPAALLALENVVLQPHRGSATQESRAEMAQLVARNLVAHFDGQALPTPVI
jgi:hydroxypyruvate reductase